MKSTPLIHTLTVCSSGQVNGIWKPEYGAASKEKIGAMPTRSIPLQWSNYPDTTKCFAITLVDNDTIPIIGFPWIHWLVANIPVSINQLSDNASVKQANYLCQGINSFASGYAIELKELEGFKIPREKAARYGGFAPVGFPHNYTVKIYALKEMVTLENGFMYNHLVEKMEGNIVGVGNLNGIYDAVTL